MDIINHREQAEERLATQFKESANLIEYIKALLRENDDLEGVYHDILNSRWIDTAEGVQLDILGAIVGQERAFSKQLAGDFFGFEATIGAFTFGTIGDANVGGVFRSESDSALADVVFDDTTYRIFIRAKAAKNITRVTINQVIDIVLQGITSAMTVRVEEGTASFNLVWDTVLSIDDKLLLAKTDFVPKPAGVNITFEDADGPFT